MSGPRFAYLVCGGRFHDFDFARLELLKLLAEDPDVRVRVGPDFADVEAIKECELLVTYTCDVRPTLEQQRALRQWVEDGGRWVALHATSAMIEHDEHGVTHTPPVAPELYETLGNRFVAHPPQSPFEVRVCDPEHPFTADLEAFTTTDELYLCEYHPPLTPLLATSFTGTFRGYADNDWPDDEPRLVAYIKDLGGGGVLYYTLGHCHGRWDLRPLIHDYGSVQRGSWDLAVHYVLLRRALAWGKGKLS
jgi:type 1 glutamine amidotransferase